jgi:hypothetical protein
MVRPIFRQIRDRLRERCISTQSLTAVKQQRLWNEYIIGLGCASITGEMILLLALLAPVVSPQSIAPNAETITTPRAPLPLPAPPAVMPQRIVVGRGLQMNPRQPLGERWVGPAFRLTHEQFETWERTVSNDPDSLCARWLLIAFGPLDRLDREPDIHLTRVDHLLWMIRHHPEWDGFSL